MIVSRMYDEKVRTHPEFKKVLLDVQSKVEKQNGFRPSFPQAQVMFLKQVREMEERLNRLEKGK